MSIGCYVKGDSINWECDLNTNITDWKIRCEIWDEGNCIKLATENSGGSDAEIEVTDATNGKFVLHVPKDETADFCNNEADIEIEVENTNDPTEIYTVLQDTLDFKNQKITWTDPTA